MGASVGVDTLYGGETTLEGVVDLPFPKNGVSLSYVNDFLMACGGRASLECLTTTEVNEKYVMPMTFPFKSSFCDMLTGQEHPAVGVATVFISHARKYLFLEVIDALLYHFRDEPGTIIWFDLFSNNQHKAADLEFHWWSTTFKSVVVFAPWNDPIPLTRGWCLFELYCTIVTRSRFEVAMSCRYIDSFSHAFSVVKNSLCEYAYIQHVNISHSLNPFSSPSISKY